MVPKPIKDKHPRLSMLCYLFSRPTVGQAMGECVKEYIEASQGTQAASMEQLVASVRRDMKDHPKVGRGTT
jgi:hypothetical protein